MLVKFARTAILTGALCLGPIAAQAGQTGAGPTPESTWQRWLDNLRGSPPPLRRAPRPRRYTVQAPRPQPKPSHDGFTQPIPALSCAWMLSTPERRQLLDAYTSGFVTATIELGRIPLEDAFGPGDWTGNWMDDFCAHHPSASIRDAAIAWLSAHLSRSKAPHR
jgi:hypothetical protein